MSATRVLHYPYYFAVFDKDKLKTGQAKDAYEANRIQKAVGYLQEAGRKYATVYEDPHNVPARICLKMAELMSQPVPDWEAGPTWGQLCRQATKTVWDEEEASGRYPRLKILDV